VARIFDLTLPASLEDEQRARFVAALKAKVRPTDAEVDLMARAYMDLLEQQVAAGLGAPGVEVYVSRATIEVDDPTGLDLESLGAQAAQLFAAATPTPELIHAAAAMVLGEATATTLGL
jgi:hypothetical protein